MATHADAKQIAWNVGYEMWIFSEAVREYSPALRDSERFRHNLLLECVLLHARVIYEFLFTPYNKKYPEDVRAVRLFDDPEQWKPDKSQLCPYLTDNLDRINRSLQHLSYDRIAFGRNPWDIHRVAAEIHTAWNFFLRQLPQDQMEWFNRAVEGQRKDDKQWFLSKVGLE
jgi:hypothetical protein